MWTLALSLALGCNGGSTKVNDGGATDTADTAEPEEDTVCPTILHTPVETAQPVGQDVNIEATVTDNLSGVFSVRLYYKKEAATSWKEVAMALGASDLWSGKIPGAEVGSGGMHYYLEAVDLKQNRCTSPTRGASDPYRFRVDGG